MFRTLAAALLVSLFATHAPAQSRGFSCQDGIWNVLKSSDIERLGFAERLAVFSKTVQGTQKRDPLGRMITVVVTDCPQFQQAILARKLLTIPYFSAQAQFAMMPQYGLYVTAAYVRNTEEADLLRGARRQVCIIRNSSPEDTILFYVDQDPPHVTRCMMEEAALANDADYAQRLVLRLLVGTMEARKSPEASQQEIQRAIDRLKALPHAPPGMLDTLEKFQRSFEK